MNQEYAYILRIFTPEILLVALGLVILAIDLFLPKENDRKLLALMASLGCVVALLVIVMHWLDIDIFGYYMPEFVKKALIETENNISIAMTGHPGISAWWFFASDKFADAFRVIFLLAAALVLLFSIRFPVKKYRGEFIALLLFATVGLMVMANTLNLVVLFLGLELASLCLYALASWQKDDAHSAEAGTKYLLLGSLASAFFIYGASLLFVLFGTTHIWQIMQTFEPSPLALVAVLMLIVGFAFKIAAAPFHQWAPDVYQGAPVSVTAFLSTASKAAGFAVLMRVLCIGFPTLSGKWGMLIALLAVVSLLVGNLVAVHQNNVKRLLAYSGIAQAGYLLIAITAFSAVLHNNNGIDPQLGITAVILYLFLYTIGNIGVFAITGIVERETGSSEMSAFAGLRTRSPLLAFAMLLLLLSLGGIPLLAGFVGKWFLFMAGVLEGHYLLVLLGTTTSVIAIYYYLLIVKQIYILPALASASPIRVGRAAGFGLLVIVLMTVAIGVYPGPFLELSREAAASIFMK